MKTVTFTCDGCGEPISTIHKSAAFDGEYCINCLQNVTTGPEECAHEDNASDAVPGRATARLVCKQCGYDREEEVS